MEAESVLIEHQGKVVPFYKADILQFSHGEGILAVHVGGRLLRRVPFSAGRRVTSRTHSDVPAVSARAMEWPIASNNSGLYIRLSRRRNRVRVVAYVDAKDYRLALERVGTPDSEYGGGVIPFALLNDRHDHGGMHID